MEFQITNVTPEGIEGVCATPAALKADLGSVLGAPVEFARKSVGQVLRTYADPCGAQVIKLAVSDREALHMAESGCLSCIRITPGSVILTDRLTDHGQMFQITKATGDKLCKRFVGNPELLAKHVSKLPAVYHRPNANSFCPGYGGGMPLLPSEYRKAMRDGLFRKPGKDAPRVNPNAR
jgi:hypothetical protein